MVLVDVVAFVGLELAPDDSVAALLELDPSGLLAFHPAAQDGRLRSRVACASLRTTA
jgi:hypothetical protein